MAALPYCFHTPVFSILGCEELSIVNHYTNKHVVRSDNVPVTWTIAPKFNCET